MPVPFLFARRRGPVALLGLPPRPGPRRLPALLAAITLPRVSWPKALLTSFEQAPPGPGPARQPLPPAGLLILGMACRILGRAQGRSLLPEALAPEGDALLSGAQQIFGSVRTQQLYRKKPDARGFVSSVFSPSVAPWLWAFGPDYVSPNQFFVPSTGQSTAFPLETSSSPVGVRSPPLTIGGVVPTGPAKMAPSPAAANKLG